MGFGALASLLSSLFLEQFPPYETLVIYSWRGVKGDILVEGGVPEHKISLSVWEAKCQTKNRFDQSP